MNCQKNGKNMAIDVIFSQKIELERLLAKKYIPRDNLALGQKSLTNKLVKVITGPRRAGKSVYCLEILSGQKFGYLNFDNEEILNIGSHEKIINALGETYPGITTLFLDEIQNLPKLELLANTLQRNGFNLVLTGSNANLLSGELATHLTGRYQEISIYPFSFREFLKAKPSHQTSLLDYLQTGGYPEIVTSSLDPQNYLSTLFEATIYKDIVKRHRIKYQAEIATLAKLLTAGFTKQISLSNLTKNSGIGSHHTINKYLNYLTETYLLMPLGRFHYKTSQRVKSANKIYFPDTGFAKTIYSPTPDFGKLLENAVFIELIRNGFKPNRDLFYYQTRTNKEVDFLVFPKTSKPLLVQSCFDLADPKTKKREESALGQAGEELGCKSKAVVTKETFAQFSKTLL